MSDMFNYIELDVSIDIVVFIFVRNGTHLRNDYLVCNLCLVMVSLVHFAQLK